MWFIMKYEPGQGSAYASAASVKIWCCLAWLAMSSNSADISPSLMMHALHMHTPDTAPPPGLWDTMVLEDLGSCEDTTGMKCDVNASHIAHMVFHITHI